MDMYIYKTALCMGCKYFNNNASSGMCPDCNGHSNYEPHEIIKLKEENKILKQIADDYIKWLEDGEPPEHQIMNSQEEAERDRIVNIMKSYIKE